MAWCQDKDMVYSGTETLEFLEIRLLIRFGVPVLQVLQRRDRVHGRDRLNFLRACGAGCLCEESALGVRHQQTQGVPLKGW